VLTFLHLKEASIEKKMKEMIAKGDHTQGLTMLSFAKAELHLIEWEHDQEFEYQHTMYDVVRQDESKDSITYYCIKDHEESKLKAAATDLLLRAQGQPLQKGQQTQLSLFLRALICPTEQEYSDKLTLAIVKNPAYLPYLGGRNAAAPMVPPPKV
jgi:hypothetical protein